MIKKIIHFDIDCFFVSVELINKSWLYNKPVAVGGFASEHGVISSCNYPARECGIYASMSTKKAFNLCKNLILFPCHINKYILYSQMVIELIKKHTKKISFSSYDEGYFEIYGRDEIEIFKKCINIKNEINIKTKLTISFGISNNKYLSKIAANINKPDGIFEINSKNLDKVMENLPIESLYGVGKKAIKILKNLKIRYCSELKKLSILDIVRYFNISCEKIFYLIRGINYFEDEKKEKTNKCISCEKTFNFHVYYSNYIDIIVILFNSLKKKILEIDDNYTINRLFIKMKFINKKVTSSEIISSDKFNLIIYKNLVLSEFNKYKIPIIKLALGVRLKKINLLQYKLFNPAN